MKFRSWLIVPANSEKRLGLATAAGADVIVLDLADTVPPAERAAARGRAAEWLRAHGAQIQGQPRPGRWVRINPLDSGCWRDDLQAIMAGAPDGIVLPGAAGPEAVRLLASELYECEQRLGIGGHATLIMPVVGQSPRAALTIPEYLDTVHQRLSGLTWCPLGLGESLGASRTCDTTSGEWTDALRFVRAQTLLTAQAGQLMAIDSFCADFADEERMVRAAKAARQDGFTGIFAIHPDQVGPINAAFTPDDPELAEAREIIVAFSANPQTGSVPFGGRMIDRRAFEQAQRTLASVERDDPVLEVRRTSAILRPM